LGNLKGDALANALMKSETKAKRRVTLSIAGLGWLDETELETIPVAKIENSPDSSAAAEKVRSSGSVSPQPLPEGEASTAGDFSSNEVVSPTARHPTADEITTLVDTARAANVSLEAFGHDMRRLMKLPDGQKITKKFLRETMTMAQYKLARKEYSEKLRVILEEDVPNHEPPAETREPDASTAAPASAQAQEGVAVPFVGSSSSAPGPHATGEADATERDRQRLRQEVASWDLRVSPEEIEHVITYSPYSKARQLLWSARRQTEVALAS
jgi:hypothetical protein